MIITPRNQWGARYPDGFGNAPLPAREVWLHHSVTAAPRDDVAAEKLAMRQLEDIGQQRFGGGISYTWAVMPSGRAYQGHSVGREGAHTKNRNSIARAIVLVGNYDVQQVTDGQIQAVGALLRLGAQSGWIAAARLNGGHRSAPGAATACPGKFGVLAIPAMNAAAGSGAPQPVKPVPGPAAGLPSLGVGSRGPSVEHLQTFLRVNFPAYAKSLPTTGFYGEQTKGVISEFQRRVRVPVTGACDVPTNGALWAHGYRG